MHYVSLQVIHIFYSSLFFKVYSSFIYLFIYSLFCGPSVIHSDLRAASEKVQVTCFTRTNGKKPLSLSL